MKKYKFNDHARKEYISTTLDYLEISPSLANRFVREFQETLLLIRRFPGIGGRTHGGAKKFDLDVFKYTIVYYLLNDIIHIIAVAPQRKKPGYWKSRLKDIPE